MDINLKPKIKKITIPVKEELEKVAGTAKEQLTSSETPKISPIVEAMQASGKTVTPQEVQKMRSEMKKRTDILEAEIAKERNKRREADRQRVESQQQENKVVQPGEPFVMPASKPSRGMLPGSKPKSPEMMKSKK